VHATVAGLGYPCPPALLSGDAQAGLGAAFLVMPEVPGRVMLDAMRGPGVVRLPRMLADLQLALHALDVEVLRRALGAAGFDPARFTVTEELSALGHAIEGSRLDGLREALAWLTEHRPPDPAASVICHGDFHPLNVLVARGRVTGVVDWSASHLRFADPAYDVGATIALLRHGPLDVPRGLRTLAALGRRWWMDGYLRSYRRGRALDPTRLRHAEALRTLGFLVEGGMHRQAAAGVIEPRSKPSAFASPSLLAAAAQRLHALTGVLPATG
jgi:aminoglycoside phosphotransferase (APT) family kinase protein